MLFFLISTVIGKINLNVNKALSDSLKNHKIMNYIMLSFNFHTKHSNMLHTYSLFKLFMTGTLNDKLHDISRYTKKNANTPHDIIFDFNKLNDAGEIACPLK